MTPLAIAHPLFEECYLDCDQCLVSVEHRVVSGGDKDAKSGQHGCEDLGTTCEYHACGVSAGPPLGDIYRMVAEEDLAGLMARLPRSNLEYAPERGVLQVRADCGRVISQLPLSSSAASALLAN